jgi:3-deoxy-D-manno-octulosonic acid hydroxylase-like protein
LSAILSIQSSLPWQQPFTRCECNVGATPEAITITEVITLPTASWQQHVAATDQQLAADALERGAVLLFPALEFSVQDSEAQYLNPAMHGDRKNVSFDPSTGSLRGASVDGTDDLPQLRDMLGRYAASSRQLLLNLLPHYEKGLQQARTSFRPVEIANRQTSWRKDDTRLHVDSFPSRPTAGNRILRVFTNINPQGQGRHWRLGEPFERVAQRYLPSISAPVWGVDRALAFLRITKRRRTAYDHYMLRLHDRMKADSAYQAQAAQRPYEFAPGSTWIVFTDQVSHAAMAGQHVLEQTFHLPVDSMLEPSRAPLRVLENLLGRPLA